MYTVKTGRPVKYPIPIHSQVTAEQKEFIDQECKKLQCTQAEYLRMVIQDLMDTRP